MSGKTRWNSPGDPVSEGEYERLKGEIYELHELGEPYETIKGSLEDAYHSDIIKEAYEEVVFSIN